MIKLELDERDIQVIMEALDLATKQGGLKSAQITLPLTQKIVAYVNIATAAEENSEVAEQAPELVAAED